MRELAKVERVLYYFVAAFGLMTNAAVWRSFDPATFSVQSLWIVAESAALSVLWLAPWLKIRNLVLIRLCLYTAAVFLGGRIAFLVFMYWFRVA